MPHPAARGACVRRADARIARRLIPRAVDARAKGRERCSLTAMEGAVRARTEEPAAGARGTAIVQRGPCARRRTAALKPRVRVMRTSAPAGIERAAAAAGRARQRGHPRLRKHSGRISLGQLAAGASAPAGIERALSRRCVAVVRGIGASGNTARRERRSGSAIGASTPARNTDLRRGDHTADRRCIHARAEHRAPRHHPRFGRSVHPRPRGRQAAVRQDRGGQSGASTPARKTVWRDVVDGPIRRRSHVCAGHRKSR